MLAKRSLTIATIALALAALPAGSFAQSQAEKTGSGVAAGQELGGMPVTVLAVAGIVAVAVGVAIAAASSSSSNSASLATVTSTSTR